MANKSYRDGFTIVELLVVIVVIGILAAIGVVGYGQWQDGIAETAVKNDLLGLTSAMKNAKNFGKDGYPVFNIDSTFDSGPNGAAENRQVFTSSKDVQMTYVVGDSKEFCAEAHSISRPDIKYYIDSFTNDLDPQAGTCGDIGGDDGGDVGDGGDDGGGLPTGKCAKVTVTPNGSNYDFTLAWGTTPGATQYVVSSSPGGGTIYYAPGTRTISVPMGSTGVHQWYPYDKNFQMVVGNNCFHIFTLLNDGTVQKDFRI